MHCRVAGRQTVPRSELTALLKVLCCMHTAHDWKVFIDAQYVIDGLLSSNRYFFTLGRNGDLWHSIFRKLDEHKDKGLGNIDFIKVKSHVTSQEEWERYGMTAEKLIYNELADEAARKGCKSRTNLNRMKDDGAAKHEA